MVWSTTRVALALIAAFVFCVVFIALLRVVSFEGPYRIVQQPRAFGTEPSASVKVKELFDRLSRMAPSEVTGIYLALYPTVVGNLTPAQVPKDWLASFWPWCCAVLVVIVKGAGTSKHFKLSTVQWGAVATSVFAFIFWVMTMGHYIAFLSDLPFLRDSRVHAVGAVLFTFVIPYFVKGDPPERPRQGGAAQ